MRNGLVEIQTEECMSQRRLEASLTSIKDQTTQLKNLANTRMSEMQQS